VGPRLPGISKAIFARNSAQWAFKNCY